MVDVCKRAAAASAAVEPRLSRGLILRHAGAECDAVLASEPYGGRIRSVARLGAPGTRRLMCNGGVEMDT